MNPQEVYEHAVLCWRQRKLPEAEALCREILEKLPTHAPTWQLLAVVLVGLNQPDTAIKIFRQLLADQPDDVDVLVNLGTAIAKSGRLDQAIATFERAMRLKPDSGPAVWNLNGTLQAKMMARKGARREGGEQVPYLGDKVVLLRCPPPVRQRLRLAGLHGGYDAEPGSGADPWLSILLAADDDRADLFRRVQKWLEWLRNEAAMSGSTCTAWAEEMPDDFAALVRRAAGADLIEAAGDDAGRIIADLSRHAVPPPPTADKIFAVVSVRNGGLELLPHWLEHYTKLGADELLVGVFEDVGQSVHAELDRLRQRWRFRTFPQYWGSAVEAEHYSQRQTGLRLAGALPETWILHTDLDELQVYPAPPRQVADEAGRKGIKVIGGLLCDRVAADGALPMVTPVPSIWEQFPVDCGMTRQITRGKREKVMMARFSVQVSVGHHVAFNEWSAAPIGSAADYRVAHFKWHGDLIDRLRWGMARPNSSPIWKGETKALIDWLDMNGGRINLNEPGLAEPGRVGTA
jgi:tetratricopeptide repeat protein